MNLDITGQPFDTSTTVTATIMNGANTLMSAVAQYGARKTVQLSEFVYLKEGTQLSTKLSSTGSLDSRNFVGGYSVYFVEALDDTRGHHSKLTSNFQVNQVNQWQNIDNNWAATDASFAENADAAPYVVPADGIYLVSFTAALDRVDFGVRAAIYIQTASASTVNGDNAQGRVSSSSSGSETIILNTAVSLKTGDEISFRIFPEAAEGGVTLLQDRTTRSIVMIESGTLSITSEGASLYLPNDIPRYAGPTERLIPNLWQHGSTYPGTYVAKNVTIGENGEIIVLRPGIFHVALNVIIKNWDFSPRLVKFFYFLQHIFRSK